MKATLAIALLAAAMWCAPTAQAAVITYEATLTGTAENPDVVTPGTGWAIVRYDSDTHLMNVQAEFSGLLGTTTAAHIHCCQADPLLNAGVATMTPSFAGFPLGVSDGVFDVTYDMSLASSYNPAFITSSGGSVAAAESRLFLAMAGAATYLNIHTSFRPGGEIRGTLHVPEPSGLALSLLSLAALGGVSRRRSS